MKKLFCLLLAVVMMVSVCACQASSEDEQAKSPDTQQSVQPEVEQQPEKGEDEAVEEQVVLDESGILITVKELDKNGIFGADLKVLIENNSDRDITVQVRDSSVNGYMVETMISSDVAAGKKANDSITFVSSDLKSCGISSIADMEFSFHIFDDDWETIVDSAPIKIKTSLAESYDYSFDDSGEELYSENGIRIISRGFSNDESIFGPGLVLFVENTSEKDVTLQVGDVSVNGFMVDTIFSEDIIAGKRSVSAITIMSSSLEENEIEEIESMEFYFHAFESDGWDTIFDTDKITVDAK